MADYFLDSSAVVKRYLAETGTGWVRNLLDPTAGNDVHLAILTGVEVVSAIVRHVPPLAPVHLPQVLSDFQFDFQNQYLIIPIDAAVIHRAISLAQRHRLRGYDAVQLAAALELRDAALATGAGVPTFVSADQHLNMAAQAESLAVDDPNAHP